MVTPLAAGVIAAVLGGGAHWLAHRTFGAEELFDSAGVDRAGITVMLVSFLIGWGATRFRELGTADPSTLEAALIAIVVGFGAMLVLNRGRWQFVNLPAQKEPALIALGVFAILARPVLGIGSVIVGVGLIGLGLAGRFVSGVEI